MHIDWPALRRAGLFEARLPPDVFWALTPAELIVILGRQGAHSPLGSQGLAALMAAFPDEPKTETST